MCEKTNIKRFLTYLDRYQKRFDNKGCFLLAFYTLGYINKNTSLIMEEYSKQIGLTGFNYEEMKTRLHQFVFEEAKKHTILPSNLQQVLRKFKTVFDGQDFDMAKIINFVKQEYIESVSFCIHICERTLQLYAHKFKFKLTTLNICFTNALKNDQNH